MKLDLTPLLRLFVPDLGDDEKLYFTGRDIAEVIGAAVLLVIALEVIAVC